MWQEHILNIFFPKFCFGCKKEGDYLCEDCKATLEISGFHEKYQTKYLSDLYFALRYDKPLIKKLIKSFRNEPFIKELSKPLASLILNHFQLLDNEPNLSDFSLIPMPITKKELKWRGYNPAEEIAKELSGFSKIPLILDCLTKGKQTLFIENKEAIQNKNIVLVNDIYETDSMIEEATRALKEAEVKEVMGVVVARLKPGENP
ncbi:MAG: hypothetical protein WC514_01080 [Candidatus Paceibacterota bacterium]